MLNFITVTVLCRYYFHIFPSFSNNHAYLLTNIIHADNILISTSSLMCIPVLWSDWHCFLYCMTALLSLFIGLFFNHSSMNPTIPPPPTPPSPAHTLVLNSNPIVIYFLYQRMVTMLNIIHDEVKYNVHLCIMLYISQLNFIW